MAAKRCSLHSINYPWNYNRCLVPGCMDELMKLGTSFPDDDFEDQAASFASMMEDNEEHLFVTKKYHPDVVHLGVAAVPDCATADVTEFKDHLWVGHHALLRAGYEEPRGFDVVMIHGRFYELQGRAHPEATSGALAGGVWWIEQIDPDNFRFPDTFEEVNEIWQRS